MKGSTYFFRVYDNDEGDNDTATDSDNLVYLEGAGVNAEGDGRFLSALVRRFTPLFSERLYCPLRLASHPAPPL